MARAVREWLWYTTDVSAGTHFTLARTNSGARCWSRPGLTCRRQPLMHATREYRLLKAQLAKSASPGPGWNASTSAPNPEALLRDGIGIRSMSCSGAVGRY